MPVATPRTKNLKLYTEPTQHLVRPQIESFGSLPEVLQAFQRTTGWSLRYAAGPEPNPPNDLIWSAPVNPGVGNSPGHFRLEPADSESSSGGKTTRDVASTSSSDGKTTRVASDRLRQEAARRRVGPRDGFRVGRHARRVDRDPARALEA